MAYAERHTVSITTAADGTGTGYTSVVTGRVLAIIYTKTDYADGVDFTITAESSGLTIWTQENVNATATVYPRAQVHSTAGAGLTYDATRTVCEAAPVANERVKIAITAGGATKTGSFVVIVGE